MGASSEAATEYGRKTETVPNRFETFALMEVLAGAVKEALVKDRVDKGIRRPCRSRAGALPASRLKGMPDNEKDHRANWTSKWQLVSGREDKEVTSRRDEKRNKTKR